MKIAVTGGTGFLGRYIVRHLASLGHSCRCWYRPSSDRGGFEDIGDALEWVPGDLSDPSSMERLLTGAEAVVHAALYRPGAGFRGAEGDISIFVERNVLGTIRLIDSARRARAERFVFIATCAMHEVILDDRPLDESHPLWPTSHYGAHKAAIEKFVHSYGLGDGYNICSLRPTGIYGVARPARASKWFDVIEAVRRGEAISSTRAGKEVHAADVAKAVGILLTANGVAGQAYNCYDRYIAEQDVAAIARELSGSDSTIEMQSKRPRHQIDTSKLKALGMEYGGSALLQRTVQALLEA